MRVYLDAVILKFSWEEQVALLRSHMIRLVKEEKLLSLALTIDPGNVTFQQLILMYGMKTNRLTFVWSLKLECFLIKKRELCLFTMSLTKWPSCTESRPHSLRPSTLGFHFRIGKIYPQWQFVIFHLQSKIYKSNRYWVIVSKYALVINS